MWRGLKRDVVLILGGFIILYMVARLCSGTRVTQCMYFLLLLILSILMLGMQMIMYKRFTSEVATSYRITTTMFAFQSLNIIYGLIMAMTNYNSPIIYKMILFECNVLECLCIPLYLKYAGKDIEQDKITTYVASCFLCAILISKYIWKHMGMFSYKIAMVGVVVLLVSLSGIGVYLTKQYKWRLSEKGIKYLNAFWLIRTVYFILGVYWAFCADIKYVGYIRCMLMYIKVVYTYLLAVSLYYNCLQKSWNQLVEKLRITREKIYSNHQDRDTIVNLSHELKTPINVIQSAVQILRLDNLLDQSAMIELQDIKRECTEAIKLITHMIDINKLSGGYLKAKFEVCNMVEALENIMDAYAMLYPEAHLIFNTNEEEVKLNVDVALIQRVGMYILGSMLMRGQDDIYMDLEYITSNKTLDIKLYAKEIDTFIRSYQKDMAKCKTEDVSELFALEFMKRILELHKVKMIHEGTGCLKVTFFNVITSEEEPIFLEDNIEYLKEQIKNYYYYA